MRARSSFLAALALGVTLQGAQAQGFSVSGDSVRAGEVLDSACGNLKGSNGNFEWPKVADCLSALKSETRLMANDQKEKFAIHGPAREQDGYVAGVTHSLLGGECASMYEPHETLATPRETVLQVTGDVAKCLNVVYDSGHLQTIRLPFDEARYNIIALTQNCVRGIEDPDARAVCDSARALLPQ